MAILECPHQHFLAHQSIVPHYSYPDFEKLAELESTPVSAKSLLCLPLVASTAGLQLWLRRWPRWAHMAVAGLPSLAARTVVDTPGRTEAGDSCTRRVSLVGQWLRGIVVHNTRCSTELGSMPAVLFRSCLQSSVHVPEREVVGCT